MTIPAMCMNTALFKVQSHFFIFVTVVTCMEPQALLQRLK